MSNVIAFTGLNAMASAVHQNAIDHGWHEQPRPIMESLMLIVTEVAEVAEEHRNGLDPKVTYLKADKDGRSKPEGIPIEIADIIIRCLDLAGQMGIDIEAAMTRKHLYNISRPYRHGGKKA